MTRNEDFLFAQEAIAQGFVGEAQVEEALLLQKRMAEDLKLDERLGVILVKRGYLAEDQARRVYARIEPDKTGEIRGYRLLDVIGRGAMGTVYRALHLGLNRVVALKILRPDLRGDRTQVERLKAEASMLASLDHPNVVRALDAGESNGYPYFVMEYVEGETLRDRLRREGPLPEAEALRITRALADALERARRMGIVHRDVKPGNVLLSRNGTPKLMDLGLAKGPIDLGLTQHGATVGTPQYISPEQAVDPRKADTRSDIYGLGATLYAMLTGEPPFDGQTLAEILTKVLYETPVPLRTRRPDASREVGFLVERMMLKDPTLRYKVPAAVVADIDRIEQGASILPSGFTGSWEGWLLRARTRKTLLVGGAVAGVVALLVLGGSLFASRLRANQDRSTFRQRIERELRSLALDPADDGEDVRKKAQSAALLTDAVERAGVEPENLGDLRRLRVQLEQETEAFQLLADTLRREVGPAEDRGEFDDGERALGPHVRERANRPVRLRAEERLRVLHEKSDDAMKSARVRHFETRPETLEAAAVRAESWFEGLSRFATTPAFRQERRDADAAVAAFRALREEVARAAAVLAPADLRPRLAAMDLSRPHDDVRAAAAAAAHEARAREPALAPYFGPGVVQALVQAPFDEAERELVRIVEREYEAVAARAQELVDARRVPEAIALFERLRDAATRFPAVSAWAGQRAAALEQTHAAHVRQAQAAWSTLLSRVLSALRAGETDEVRRVVAEARADPATYGPVQRDVDRVGVAADLLDELWARVAAGLEARVGADRRLWLDQVRLRDGTTAHAWEVRAVDRAARTVTVVSHRGNINREPETHAFAELDREQLAALAGLVGGRDDAIRAVLLLSSLPDETEDLDPRTDPAARLEDYRRVRDLFERGEEAGSPLAIWVSDRADQLARLVARLDAEAAATLASAREAYARGDNTAAFHRFHDLRQAPLAFTRTAREHAPEIEERIARIRREMEDRRLELLLPHARVKPLVGDLTQVAFDFDTLTQGENLREGLARFVDAARTSPTTPNERPNMRLRLVPAPDGSLRPPGELVRDRPLVLASMLDPSKERSVAFSLWTADPFFFAIDLDGVQVAVLSADPRRWPFPPGVPTLDDERRPPAHDFYGRGLGVVFRAGGRSLDKAWEWNAWKEDHQGRRFVPPDRDRRRAELGERFFGFEPRPDQPYRVRLAYAPEGRVRLEVDGVEVHAEGGADWRPRIDGRNDGGRVHPTGVIQILSYTSCDIDDLEITGKISERWREAEEQRLGAPRAPTGK